MNVLLPSEIARLVLGYLSSVKCSAAREKFLEECPHLREYVFYLGNGHEYPTNISGYDLIHYLNIGFQYTQFITCGESIKFPLPTAASYFGFQNRAFASGSTGQESPAQIGPGTAGTPLTSPRTNPPPYRTPRTAWANASPATDRRSPAESIIDVTTVTEPPSSEPQIPPPKRLSEVAIQTEDVDSREGLPAQPPTRGEETALVLSQQSTPRLEPQPELIEPQSQPIQRLQMIQHPSSESLPQKSQQQHPQLFLHAQREREHCVQQTQQLQPLQVHPRPQQLGSQIAGEPQQPELLQGNGQISNLVSNNLQITPAHQFALPSVPTSTPLSNSRVQQAQKKDQMELSIGFPQCLSPKRKPVAPKRRSLGTPLDMFASPPSMDPGSTKKAIDELVQTQLAEKIAESINEVATVMRPPPPAEDTCPSLLSCGSNLPDNLLSDVISKTLSDPIMEELAQYMVIQSNTIDLETPTGTPLKGSALKTPFKQIAEDMARQGTSGSVDFGQAGHAHMNSTSDSQSLLSTGFPIQSMIASASSLQNAPASESMKIVVDSSFPKDAPKSPMLRCLPAPRKPSPKLSPPGSTTSTLLDERIADSEPSKSNKSSTLAATSFSIGQIKPIPGTHIRALDFGTASTKQGPSAEAGKLRSYRNRKRKSPVVSVEMPTKSKRTSSRSRCLPSSVEDITAPTSGLGPPVKRPEFPTVIPTTAPSATVYGPSTGFNGAVAGKPTVIVSIPDSPQPKLSSSSPRNTRPPTTSSQRRQAILVEPVPPSRKTTPKRVSTSRAKPRSRASLASQVAQNGTGSTSNVKDFVMPSTPKKIPGPSAASVRANGRLNKPRGSNVASSDCNKESPAVAKSAPVGTASTHLVTAPTPSDFSIDIAALLDKVHKV